MRMAPCAEQETEPEPPTNSGWFSPVGLGLAWASELAPAPSRLMLAPPDQVANVSRPGSTEDLDGSVRSLAQSGQSDLQE